MEALKELRRLFPDGVADFLTADGKVDPRHAMTDDDRAAEAESAEHVKGWHAALHRIDLEHAANESAANEIEADNKLNAALNSLSPSSDAEEWVEGVSGDDDLEADVDTVMEALKDIEGSEIPDYPGRPDPDDYRRVPEDLDEEFDEPIERRDHLQSVREEHESAADDFSEQSKEYREQAEEMTAAFREEQVGLLESLRNAVADALKIPAKRWAEASEGAERIRDELVKLGEHVGTVLKTLSPDG